MVFQSMAPRVVVAALLLIACAPGSLRAQDVAPAGDPVNPVKRWPEQLKNRNAHYANLARVDDPAGDAHEVVIAKALTERVDDPLGDREERRRHLCAKHVPPRATEFARMDRDAGDDREQIVIAETRNRPGQKRASRLAEVRRFRDLAGDADELVRWKLDRTRGPMVNDPDAYRIVNEGQSERTGRFFEEREDTIHIGGAETSRDLERERDAEDDRDTERQLGREEAREEDRRSERVEAAVDAATERDAEREAEKTDEKAADAAEREGERETERADESKTDREAERQLEQEEQNAPSSAGN